MRPKLMSHEYLWNQNKERPTILYVLSLSGYNGHPNPAIVSVI